MSPGAAARSARTAAALSIAVERAARPDTYEGLLAELDRLGGCVPGDPRSLYERVTREVVREAGGTAARAWMYVAAPAVAARLRTRGKPVEGGERRGRG